MKEKTDFTNDDLDLLIKAVKLDPGLETAVRIAKAVRKSLKYPIKDVETMRSIFSPSEKFVSGGSLVRYEQLKTFVPESFFPVENEEDLLALAFIAKRIGAQSHAHEKAPRFKFDVEYETIPGPSGATSAFGATNKDKEA